MSLECSNCSWIFVCKAASLNNKTRDFYLPTIPFNSLGAKSNVPTIIVWTAGNLCILSCQS